MEQRDIFDPSLEEQKDIRKAHEKSHVELERPPGLIQDGKQSCHLSCSNEGQNKEAMPFCGSSKQTDVIFLEPARMRLWLCRKQTSFFFFWAGACLWDQIPPQTMKPLFLLTFMAL